MERKILLVSVLMILLFGVSMFAQEIELDFGMNSTMVLPGSPFSLDLTVKNSGASMIDSTLFVALNVGTDDYWFYPGWTHFPGTVDSEQMDINGNSEETMQIIPEFLWPTGVGEFSGAMFLGAIVNNGQLVSNIARQDFGWTNFPESYQQLTINSDWFEGAIADATKARGFSFKGKENGVYYIWWDDLSQGTGTSTADITVSAYHEDNIVAYFQNVDKGYATGQMLTVAPGESEINLVVTAQDGSEGSFKIGVTFFNYSPEKAVQARTVASWMSGDFNSYEQSQQQPSYYNITLRMKRVWPDLSDGYWLYVEQAVAGSPPYRQRLYRVVMADETTVASEVYEFKKESDEDNAVGAWEEDNPLSNLSPADFESREGCTVFLSREDLETFLGGTEGKGCESDLNGATYATSEVTLIPDQMTSWDRGYNSNDQQVWGAVAGPYIFDKIDNFDSELDL